MQSMVQTHAVPGLQVLPIHFPESLCTIHRVEKRYETVASRANIKNDGILASSIVLGSVVVSIANHLDSNTQC